MGSHTRKPAPAFQRLHPAQELLLVPAFHHPHHLLHLLWVIRGQQLSSTGSLRLLPAILYIVAHHGTSVCKPLVESFLPDDSEAKNVYAQPLLALRCPVEGLLLGSHVAGHLQSLSGLSCSSRSPAFLVNDSAGLFGRKLTQYPLRLLAQRHGPCALSLTARRSGNARVMSARRRRRLGTIAASSVKAGQRSLRDRRKPASARIQPLPK